MAATKIKMGLQDKLYLGNLSSKQFEIILSSEITSNLKLGKQYGELKLIDTNNKIRTITHGNLRRRIAF